MATTAVYGKLGKPELGGGGLVIQTGKVSFSTAAATSGNLATDIRTLLAGIFNPGASGATPSAVCKVTTVSAGNAVLAKTNKIRDWYYILIGY